jgi:hypothetical protein
MTELELRICIASHILRHGGPAEAERAAERLRIYELIMEYKKHNQPKE